MNAYAVLIIYMYFHFTYFIITTQVKLQGHFLSINQSETSLNQFIDCLSHIWKSCAETVIVFWGFYHRYSVIACNDTKTNSK